MSIVNRIQNDWNRSQNIGGKHLMKGDRRMIIRLIMWLCHIYYKKYGEDIFCIKGEGKEYPKYLLYTENPTAYKQMDEF